MPESALANVEVDHVLTCKRNRPISWTITVKEIASRASRKMRCADGSGKTNLRNGFRLFVVMSGRETVGFFPAPDCGGVLWRSRMGEYTRFRCHVSRIFDGVRCSARQG